mmetsp:Transcript_72008/g.135828  ORF Transcript_72008/g.135828 Transcript_72008/m.135828 type:complete len:349 (-) Transcript_72008:234-1280(-)
MAPTAENDNGAATPPIWQSLVAGSAGGFFNTVVGHPLDTVKVRLQMGNKTALWGGLYAGVGSRMAGVVPDWIACYSGYTLGKRIEYPLWVPSSVCSFAAGCIAGFMGGLVLCPFDAVKITAQSRGMSTRQAVNFLGPKGLFSGFGATMVWSVPSQGVFYLAYDNALRQRHDHSFTSCVVAGGLAGCAEWALVLPLDTVKTRVQSGTSPDFLTAFSDIRRLHGAKGFYRGFGPVMLRAFPASGAALGGIYMVETQFAKSDELARAVLREQSTPNKATSSAEHGQKGGGEIAEERRKQLAATDVLPGPAESGLVGGEAATGGIAAAGSSEPLHDPRSDFALKRRTTVTGS